MSDDNDMSGEVSSLRAQLRTSEMAYRGSRARLEQAQLRVADLESQARDVGYVFDEIAAIVGHNGPRGDVEGLMSALRGLRAQSCDELRAKVAELEAEVARLRGSERVICSAVRLPNGMVFRGHRHGDCLRTAAAFVEWNGGVDPGEHHWESVANGVDQGFVTSTGRYVDREEGRAIQDAAGIESVADGGYRGRLLFSEDLY